MGNGGTAIRVRRKSRYYKICRWLACCLCEGERLDRRESGNLQSWHKVEGQNPTYLQCFRCPASDHLRDASCNWDRPQVLNRFSIENGYNGVLELPLGLLPILLTLRYAVGTPALHLVPIIYAAPYLPMARVDVRAEFVRMVEHWKANGSQSSGCLLLEEG